MARRLAISMCVFGLSVLGACHSHTSSTRTESSFGAGVEPKAVDRGNTAGDSEQAQAPIFAEICVPTSLPPGRYVLQGERAASLPRPLRELRVAKGCAHPLAVRVCPNELGVEQEGSVLLVSSTTVKGCHEATVARFDIGSDRIRASVRLDSKCGKKSGEIASGELTRVGP